MGRGPALGVNYTGGVSTLEGKSIKAVSIERPDCGARGRESSCTSSRFVSKQKKDPKGREI